MANFNLNKVILGGRITDNLELKTTPSGVSVTAFSIAVNRKYTKDQQQQADFINCVAWRNTAEFITRYFQKGSSICLIGSLQTRNYTDSNGNKRYITEVIVDEANFVDSRNENGGAQSYTPDAYGMSAPSYSSNPDSAPNFEDHNTDDDLPF